MKFIITGSGGCVSIPKPLCQCQVCTEAREKSYPYARCGCSLYLAYSHMDPDHTLGMRVLE